MKRFLARIAVIAPLALALLPETAFANTVSLFGSTTNGATTELTVKTQVLIVMTLLGLLPVMVLMMTSFTRFVIVLSLLRQALGLLLDTRVGDVIPVSLGETEVLVDNERLMTARVAEHKGKLCLTAFEDLE